MARAPLDRTIEERPRLFFATGFCEEQREGDGVARLVGSEALSRRERPLRPFEVAAADPVEGECVVQPGIVR